MARWKLATSHYLNTVKPKKWRYTEADRTTGESIETEFLVPWHLDINDPKCWTNRWGNTDNKEGEIIVCQPDKGLKGDIEFIGDPTPDMIPQDEEAEAISLSFADHWAYKPDSVDQSSASPIPYAQRQVDRAGAVEVPGMTDLIQAIAAQTAMVGQLIDKSARRV